MKTTLAITGGTGFIGRHLARRLTEEGYRLRCLVRRTSDITYLNSLGVELVYGDITEEKTLPDLLHQVEAVFHLAGQVSVSQSIEDPSSAFFTNAVGTLKLLEILRSNNRTDCLVVYLSSDRVYGDSKSELVAELALTVPLEPYAASKLCAEHLCHSYSKAYSIPFVILRGANVYGPGQSSKLFIPSIIQQIVSGEKHVSVGNLDNYRNFIYVEDVVDALYLALSRGNQIKNETFNIAGQGAKLRVITDIFSRLSLKYLGKAFQVTQEPSLVRPSEVEGRRYQLDCSKAHELLGWSPKYSLEKGLDETLRLSLAERKVRI